MYRLTAAVLVMCAVVVMANGRSVEENDGFVKRLARFSPINNNNEEMNGLEGEPAKPSERSSGASSDDEENKDNAEATDSTIMTGKCQKDYCSRHACFAFFFFFRPGPIHFHFEDRILS